MTSTIQLKRQILTEALQNRPAKMSKHLEKLKKEGQEIWHREDLILYLLLRSFSTMGNSQGFQGLINNQENYEKLSMENLVKVNTEYRQSYIYKVLFVAGVYEPLKKSGWINKNFELIQKLGGLAHLNQKLREMEGYNLKLLFMKTFHGIGEKYARNIFMDLYDPDFHNSIAIDYRLKKITQALGVRFTDAEYDLHERYFLNIATQAGLQGWELDRLLYNYNRYFLNRLKE